MDSPVPPITIHRTTLRIAVGALFFMAGLCFASWASRIATVQQTMGLSDAALGAVLFSLPVGLMLSLPFSGWAITKIGSKRLLLSAILFYGAALVSLGLAKNTFQLIICLVCYGFASNAVNISVNTQAVANEGMYDKPIMASFHGLWSLAGFTGAGIGTLMIANGIEPLQHFIIILVILIVGVAIASRFLYDDYGVASNQEKSTLTLSERLKLITPLLTLGSIAFCSMICEGAMFDWSVIYFKKIVIAPLAADKIIYHINIFYHSITINPISLEGIGFTVFMFTMAFGRFVADGFSHRYGLRRTLQVSGSLTTIGLLTAVIFPYLITALIGFLLVGMGVSSVVPMVYSAAGKSKTMSAGVALAAVSTIGFIGFLVGPPVIGFIAGLATLRASFLFIAVMGTSVVVLSTRAKL